MANPEVPSRFRRLMVNKLSSNFREATSITEVETPELKPNEVLIKNKFVGINASDINFTSGKYFTDATPPFPCGFEGVGVVVAKGSEVTNIDVKQPVGYMNHGAFSDYQVQEADKLFPLPVVNKEFLPLLVSGLTATLALDHVGKPQQDETVLVTAAAGGTGQFAVQLAKLAGCHVIGTCGSKSKVDFLKSLGCDRVVNYNEEKLAEVLKNEYPKGLDVVYESVGGEMFDTSVNNLAVKGRVIVIGMISGYQAGGLEMSPSMKALPISLLRKSASVSGFFMPHYRAQVPAAAAKLFKLYGEGKLKSQTDNGENSDKGPFNSLESIYDAVDYLYSKKSSGKIIVELPDASAK